MSPATRWGPCPYCGADGWDRGDLPSDPRTDHDRPDGRACRRAAAAPPETPAPEACTWERPCHTRGEGWHATSCRPPAAAPAPAASPAPPRAATHELKTWPDPFAAILDGRKRYEIRKADRDFAEGDTLRLREWNEQSRAIPYGYTGCEITVRVTYMTPPGAWGLPADVCVMGIEPLRAAPPSRAPREDAPYYLADGSSVMLPAEEVERRRRLAAKVLATLAAADGDETVGSMKVYDDDDRCVGYVDEIARALAAGGRHEG